FNLLKQSEQRVMVQRERADTIRIARKGHHADEVSGATLQVFAALDKGTKGLLDRVQTTTLASINLQIQGRHAARNIHGHENGNPLTGECDSLDAALRTR